jgi:glycine/D-amino acid oxidase-like deaminating enzyme
MDLLVLGGGMAGLTAAAAAVRAGARVAVVEKGDALGGSAAYAGFVWTAPDHAVMAAVNPRADADLRARVVDDYAVGIDWMRSLGVEVRDPVTVLGYGRGSQADMAGYLHAC